MTAPARPPGSARHGMTLVELLVAVALAVVVVALVFTLYRTASLSLAGQHRRALGPHAAAEALQILRDDVARTILPGNDEACAFSLASPDNAPPELSFCCLPAAPEEGEPNWAVPLRVAYRIVESPDRQRALVRVTVPASGPGSLAASVTNVLVAPVSQFALAVSDGVEWYDTWPPPEAGSARPQRVRVELALPEDGNAAPARVTELLVPAGLSLTSALLRAATPAP